MDAINDSNWLQIVLEGRASCGFVHLDPNGAVPRVQGLVPSGGPCWIRNAGAR
jgi:hypothetical protein